MRNAAPPSKTGRLRRGMDERKSGYLTALDRLPAVHGRLKNVALSNRPAADVIREFDGPATVFYLDPPYLQSTRASPDVYCHEMTEPQHRELLDTLLTVKGKVLLSGYASPLYDTALAG
jgi:DNA adenine methylase